MPRYHMQDRLDESTVNFYVHVYFQDNRLYICPEGYGEPEALKGQGCPVFLDIWEGRLRVVVSQDILDCNSRMVIDLENAREDRVTDWS